MRDVLGPCRSSPAAANAREPIMSANFYRIAVVLGLLSAIGPFAIDM